MASVAETQYKPGVSEAGRLDVMTSADSDTALSIAHPATATSPMADPPQVDPRAPERFINRELSWIDFNQRVLDEARNPNHPLLERLRFLSISANNLDEFYMVRVAGLKAQIALGVMTASQDGMTPGQQVAAITTRAKQLLEDQQTCWHDLRNRLRAEDIVLLTPSELDDDQRAWLEQKFTADIFPILTPLAIDPAHPFPFIPNLGFWRRRCACLTPRKGWS